MNQPQVTPQYYLIDPSGEQIGPLSKEEFIQHPGLKLETLVWCSAYPDMPWVSLKDHPQLIAELPELQARLRHQQELDERVAAFRNKVNQEVQQAAAVEVEKQPHQPQSAPSGATPGMSTVKKVIYGILGTAGAILLILFVIGLFVGGEDKKSDAALMDSALAAVDSARAESGLPPREKHYDSQEAAASQEVEEPLEDRSPEEDDTSVNASQVRELPARVSVEDYLNKAEYGGVAVPTEQLLRRYVGYWRAMQSGSTEDVFGYLADQMSVYYNYKNADRAKQRQALEYHYEHPATGVTFESCRRQDVSRLEVTYRYRRGGVTYRLVNLVHFSYDYKLEISGIENIQTTRLD